jgi:putative sigma-54 modulation protein
MKINIHGEKVKITPSIKSYVDEKVAKLDKYFENPDDITANVKIKVRNDEQIIEVTVPTNDFTLRREESNSDLYAAIDLVIDKLERQIRKNKTRFARRYKNSKENADIILDFDIAKEELDTSKIIKRKDIESKPMTEDEAILEAGLLDHDFFAFKNINENCFSVLYLRKDGNYGIINMK